MDDNSLTLRMDRFESRLNRLEALLGIVAPVISPPMAESPPRPRQRMVQPLWTRPAQAEGVPEEPLELMPDPEPESEQPAPQPATELPMPVMPYEQPIPPPPIRQTHLEQTIGLKWAGWIGAVVLVIGAAFGVKFAYEQGWFSVVTPVVRLAMLALAGGALIAAGEFVYRKVNVLSATGLFGAGVAIFFVVSFAGCRYYGLYAPSTAFLFMALSTVIGAAVARRGKLVSIAVLSLIGGNLAPVLLHQGELHLFGFLAYLLMLQIVSLVLAARGATPKWWALRGLSLATTGLWIFAIHTAAPVQTTFSFLIIYTVLFQFELMLSARRSRLGAAHAGTVFSLLVTSAFIVAGLHLLGDLSTSIRVIFVLGTAAAAGGATMICARGGKKSECLHALAIGFILQSIALIILSVPIALSGIWVCLAWAGLAITLAILGRALDLPIARRSSPVVWILAIIKLAHWTIGYNRLGSNWHETALTILNRPVAVYVVAAWLLAVVGQVIARLQVAAQADDEKTEARLASILSGFLVAVVSIAGLPPLGATLALLAYALLLSGADFFDEQLGLFIQSMVFVGFAGIKWIVLDTLAARLSPTWSAGNQPPLLTPQMLVGVAIAGCIVCVYRLRRRRIWQLTHTDDHAGNFTLAIAAMVAMLTVFGLTFEIDRVVEQWVAAAAALSWPAWQIKEMAWSMLWTLGAIGFAAVALALEKSQTRRGATCNAIRSVLALIAAKYILLDTAWYWLRGGSTATPALLNLQLLTALVIAAGLLIPGLLRKPRDGQPVITAAAGTAGLLAALVLLWAGTMEIDRIVLRYIAPGLMGLPLSRWKQLLWTSWWMFGTTVYLLAMHWIDRADLRRRAAALQRCWPLPVVVAGKYLLLDMLLFRLTTIPSAYAAFPGLPLIVGTLVLGTLAWLYLATTESVRTKLMGQSVRAIIVAFCIATIFSLGSFGIDQVFTNMRFTPSAVFSDPDRAEQVALSIFWSVFALSAITAGFSWRAAGLRYFGLALFAFTLLKVVTLDLSQVSTGYRILSFMGLGLLLLGTSVVYGKLSPVLLAEKEEPTF